MLNVSNLLVAMHILQSGDQEDLHNSISLSFVNSSRRA